MRITLSADDRLLAAGAGAFAAIGGVAAVLVRQRGTARVQAARSALLGRPTAYRLHLHGTGIELAPWERNFVGECVVRRPPDHGIYMGPDVKPRPDEGGSLFRDTSVMYAPGSGFYVRGPEADEDQEPAPAEVNDFDDAGAEDVADGYLLPALCLNGHQFEAGVYARLADGAQITVGTPVRVTCPECEGDGYVMPGRYSVIDGRVVREDIEPGEDEPES